MLINVFSSFRDTFFLQIIILLCRLYKCLVVVILIAWLKHEVVVVADLEHLRYGIKSLIS